MNIVALGITEINLTIQQPIDNLNEHMWLVLLGEEIRGEKEKKTFEDLN